MKYNIDNEDKIKIFGDEFVGNNANKFSIIWIVFLPTKWELYFFEFKKKYLLIWKLGIIFCIRMVSGLPNSESKIFPNPVSDFGRRFKRMKHLFCILCRWRI